MNKCYIWVCSCVFAISFAGAAAWASPMEIHSSDGNGGESYVLTFSIPDHHINGTVWQLGGNGSRKAYMKFDLTTVTLNDPITQGTLRLTTESAEASNGNDTTIEVWAIVDGYAGGNDFDGGGRPDLAEAAWLTADNSTPPVNPQSPGSLYLTSNNAPGNNLDVNQQIHSTAAYGGVPLGTFIVADGTVGGTEFNFSSNALVDFLNTDTNGMVTFALTVSGASADQSKPLMMA